MNTPPPLPASWHPRKGMGQNFLQDPLIAAHIVAAAGVQPGARVVEIGPGLGALTRPLLAKAGQLWAIELDEPLAQVLAGQTWPGDFHLIRADALTFDFTRLAAELGGPLQVVANLPYAISSPLLFHFLDQREAFSDLTLMLQKEVVDRMAAPPGGKDYGVVSLHVQRWATVTPLFQVPPTAFRPMPKVTSTVVHLHMRPASLVEVGDETLFHDLIKAAFGQRRKTLANALSSLDLGMKAAEWLQEAGIDPRRRGETLDLNEFAALARNLTTRVR